MTSPASFSIRDTDLEAIAAAEGGVAVFVDGDGKLDPAGRRANRLTRGALDRMLADKAFAKMKSGDVKALAYPTGLVTLCAALGFAVFRRRDLP